MENEKVVQIAIGSDVFGLSSNGQLIIFDSAANCWVLKCSSEIMSFNKANTIKKPLSEYEQPQGKFRNNEVKIKKKSVLKTNGKKFLILMIPFALYGVIYLCMKYLS